MALKKNILFVVRWPVGGIRTFLKYLIKNLPKNDYKIYVLTTSEEGSKFLEADIGEFVEELIFLKHSNFIEKDLAVESFRLVINRDIKLIHAHGFTSLVCSLPASIIRKIPLMVTSHDVINSGQFKGFNGLMKRRVLKISLEHCSFVHSVSLDAENNLLSFFPNLGSKSVCIKNGIDVQRFASAPTYPVRNDIGFSNSDVILIGFFGRFMNQKGFRFLIDSIKILKETSSKRFHVACFGAGAFIREEKIKIENLGLASYFSFFDFNPDISSVMKGCDVIVMPSLWEACPLQPMEALCAGVPFVGSDCIGLREVIEGTPAVMVSAGDAKKLSEGILECVKIGRKPFFEFSSVAVERFDVKKSAIAIQGLYDRVL